MAPPIYFLPGQSMAGITKPDQRTLNRAALAAVGLGDVLADVRTVDEVSVFELKSHGPGGSSGVLLTALQPGEPPVRLGYQPDYQDWQPAGDELWIGIDREHPPQPADLMRRKRISGYKLPTECGELIVPVLRSPRGACTLPEDWGYDAAGRFTKSIKAEYSQLWEESAEIWDVVIARKDGAQISHERGLELCLRILALNYRYGRHEQNRLRWVDSENWQDILSLSVDLPGVYEYLDASRPPEPGDDQKKTDGAPSSSNASPGAQVCAPNTNQPAASSG